MEEALLGTGVREVLEAGCGDDGEGEVFVVNPTAETIERVVETAVEGGSGGPRVRMLADERRLRDAMAEVVNTAERCSPAEASPRTTAPVDSRPPKSETRAPSDALFPP